MKLFLTIITAIVLVFSTNYDSEGRTPPGKCVYLISKTSTQTLSSSTAQTTLDKYFVAENSIIIPNRNTILDVNTSRTENALGSDNTAVPIINSQNLYNKMKSQNCVSDHIPAAIHFYTHISQTLI